MSNKPGDTNISTFPTAAQILLALSYCHYMLAAQVESLFLKGSVANFLMQCN